MSLRKISLVTRYLRLLYNATCPESRRRKYYWVRPGKVNTSELGAKVTVTGHSSCLPYEDYFSCDMSCYSDGGSGTELRGKQEMCYWLWLLFSPVMPPLHLLFQP